MKYLTSRGTSLSTVEYVSDILDINFRVEYNSIPGLNIGINSLIDDLRLDEATIIVREKIDRVIRNINSRNELSLNVDNVVVTREGIEVTLSMSGVKITKLI